MASGYNGPSHLGDPSNWRVNELHQKPIEMREAMSREREGPRIKEEIISEETVRTEILKESIRNEIIAQEIARMRMLEAEVGSLLTERKLDLGRRSEGLPAPEAGSRKNLKEPVKWDKLAEIAGTARKRKAEEAGLRNNQKKPAKSDKLAEIIGVARKRHKPEAGLGRNSQISDPLLNRNRYLDDSKKNNEKPAVKSIIVRVCTSPSQ